MCVCTRNCLCCKCVCVCVTCITYCVCCCVRYAPTPHLDYPSSLYLHIYIWLCMRVCAWNGWHCMRCCTCIQTCLCQCLCEAQPSNTLQHTATCCNALYHTVTHCSILPHTTEPCNALQHTMHCNTYTFGATLRHASYCNALQGTAFAHNPCNFHVKIESWKRVKESRKGRL